MTLPIFVLPARTLAIEHAQWAAKVPQRPTRAQIVEHAQTRQAAPPAACVCNNPSRRNEWAPHAQRIPPQRLNVGASRSRIERSSIALERPRGKAFPAAEQSSRPLAWKPYLRGCCADSPGVELISGFAFGAEQLPRLSRWRRHCCGRRDRQGFKRRTPIHSAAECWFLAAIFRWLVSIPDRHKCTSIFADFAVRPSRAAALHFPETGGALPCEVQNFVISSSERPLVSGISQATKTIVSSAPALKHQKVPSAPRFFSMVGNS